MEIVQLKPVTNGLATTYIDASAGAITVPLPASTLSGIVKFFTNADVTNTATLTVPSGDTLNGVVDGTFLLSNYPPGTQFRTDEVGGGWVVSVVGASVDGESVSSLMDLTDITATGTALVLGTNPAGGQVALHDDGTATITRIGDKAICTLRFTTDDDDVTTLILGESIVPAGGEILSLSVNALHRWSSANMEVKSSGNTITWNRTDDIDSDVAVEIIFITNGWEEKNQQVLAGMISTGLDSNIIKVFRAAQLAGVLLSNKVYEIHGTVDMGAQSIDVPATGLNIRGLGFGVSRLTSSETNYSMFTAPAGGSGTLNITALEIEVSGTASQVFNLTDATGFNAVEMNKVNFINCTSRGGIIGYRQGLEQNTGYFGGTPTLTMTGNWVGGYRATTVIVRNVSATTVLFKAGTGLTLNSRFLTDMNAVLQDGASVCDFSPANIVNDGDFQVNAAEFSGLTDNTQYFPNLPANSQKAYFKDSKGILNTYPGGSWKVITEVVDNITVGVPTLLGSTLQTIDQTHFTLINNVVTYTTNQDASFLLFVNFIIDGAPNSSLTLSVTTPTQTLDFTTDVHNVTGGQDIAMFNSMATLNLSQGDTIEFFIINNTNSTNTSLLLGSNFHITKR